MVLGIPLSRVEIESFLKSFFLFFISLGILSGSLFFINYNKETQGLDDKLFTQMRVCSYDLKCTNFELDFVDLHTQELYRLYKDSNGLKSYFPIPKAQKFVMVLKLSSQKYEAKLNALKNQELYNFFFVLGAIFILSIIFSIYALLPLRNALLLTQEFIKDILHDFNTPLASLSLNSSMLKREIGENEKVNRIQRSVANILDLQNHLRSYLENHSLQKEEFDLESLLKEHIDNVSKNYPDISFSHDVDKQKLLSSKEAFSRVVDNVLSNAAKYNIRKGQVHVLYKNDLLQIIDTGKGIKNPKKVFERFYKEQDRGIGIGLHIVKKLCDELKIKISIESKLEIGTTFTLNLSKLVAK